ncbi:hypothetical protein QA802_30835 [Streptomyces sp. B21-105]|uniref:hypothetical protein n=1 Tax=Streptomyces sp. B21-105 TaxID=3039417 RepID=UPI002FEF2B8B
MTTASQTPGALPPETPAAVTAGTTYADPWQGSDVPYALRSPFPEPATEGPACTVCTAPAGVEDTALRPDPRGRRYPSGAQVLYCKACLPPAPAVKAAEGVIAAAMKAGKVTPRELAQAEYETGILFDAQAAADIASAAREQAHADDQAEIDERGRQLARMAGDHRKVTAVLRLLEGRPGTDLLTVAEIAAAVEYGTTAFDSFPMTLRWTGGVDIPGPKDTHKRAVIECKSSYGGRAHLVVEGDARIKLASLVDAEVRDIHAPCTTELCGTDHDFDPTDMFGWARLEVAGIADDRPRWYCSPPCVSNAVARAGDALAADDQAAAVDPDEQGSGPLYGDDAHWAARTRLAEVYVAEGEDQVDDVARCVRCGCTEDAACEGGCHWVPNHQMADLCSRCANPAELAIATRGLE